MFKHPPAGCGNPGPPAGRGLKGHDTKFDLGQGQGQNLLLVCFFGVLITNIMLVLITDYVFMHLGQVGSGQVMSTGRGPAAYS